MKPTILPRALAATIFSILSLSTFAQDGLDIDINLDTREWYENPLVWVIGGLVLLLLVVLLSRGKK